MRRGFRSPFIRVLLLSLCLPVLPALCVPAAAITVGCYAEWDPPTDILVHTPGDELFAGVIHPEAALFERAFEVRGAAAEHRAYISLLRQSGARVHTVLGALLQGTVDPAGRPVPGPELDALRQFAGQFLAIDASALNARDQTEQAKYKQETLSLLPPRELVAIILNCPTVRLRPSEVANTRYTATYEFSPVMNLYFSRDQQVTTSRGVVVGRMNSEQRRVETRIMAFVLRKLGIQPIYEVTGDGRLEGGDFIPCGDTALIGQGLRTNPEGIRQLLDNRVFGVPRVAVVKDPWQHQDQMHLDTYFNVLSPTQAVLVEERMDVRDGGGRVVKPARADRRCTVDVYLLQDGRYRRTGQDLDFQAFLEGELGFSLIPVSNDDQLRYAINFLCIAPGRILGVAGASEGYRAALQGVHATWMDFSNLTGGYGAAHCCTQVLHRRRVPAQ